MSSRCFLSTALLCAGLVAAVAGATEERSPQSDQSRPAPMAPEPIAPVVQGEPVLHELQTLERHVRMNMILFMPTAPPAPVLAVTSWPK